MPANATAKPRSKAQERRDERDEQLAALRVMLPPGSRVYTIVSHCARSGMSRSIRVLVATVGDDGRPQVSDESWRVALALERKLDRDRGGVVCHGCGMDMTFELTHQLSYALHGMQDVGDKAKAKASSGRPFAPTADQYRAGYSLVRENL